MNGLITGSGKKASDVWNERINNFIYDNNVKYMNYTFVTSIDVKETRDYEFYSDQSYSSWKINIDDEEFSYMDKCYKWSDKHTFTTNLEKGIHSVVVSGYFSSESDFSIVIRWDKENENKDYYPIPFVKGILLLLY